MHSDCRIADISAGCVVAVAELLEDPESYLKWKRIGAQK